jgi:hypothetical protein
MTDKDKKGYRIEVWVTAICFAFVAVTGGFFSSVVVILNEIFFDLAPASDRVIELLGPMETMYVAKESMMVMGFPLHYFLLIFLSWIGATVIGAIWCIVMDKVEEQQRL